MNDHPTQDELSRFLRGGLAAGRVAAVVRHLEDCGCCADQHPQVETLLTSYVDGKLRRADADAVAVHLDVCPTCREDVDDLRAIAALLAPNPIRRWAPLAAAAAVAIIVIAALVTRNRMPPPVPAPQVTQTATNTPPAPVVIAPRYARPEWAGAVDDALRRGTIDMPAALARLQLAPDPERSPGDTAERVLEPASTIVESTRPQLRWTPVPGAIYVVSLFDGPNLIAESPQLREPRWQPQHPLPRGRTYQWQIAATTRTTTTIMPAPPAPPAFFRVLDTAAHDELARARAAHAADPLLLGVLYARAGLREDAERELARVPTAQGRALLESVQAWK